jgi:hypothetical protein
MRLKNATDHDIRVVLSQWVAPGGQAQGSVVMSLTYPPGEWTDEMTDDLTIAQHLAAGMVEATIPTSYDRVLEPEI